MLGWHAHPCAPSCPAPFVAGRPAVVVRAAGSKKGSKQETVEYGESWYEQTRRLGARPGRTVREELGERMVQAGLQGTDFMD